MELKLTELSRDNIQDIVALLQIKPSMPLFFYSQFSLITWLTHDGKKLYLAELHSGEELLEQAIIVHKEIKNDIRFLFYTPSHAMIEKIQVHYSPSYIACNEIYQLPEHLKFFDDIASATLTQSAQLQGAYFAKPELTLHIDTLLTLQDQDIRRYYKVARERNPQLTVHTYSHEQFEQVKDFLSAWNNTRSPEYNKYAKTENDIFFLENFGMHPDVHGVIIQDGVKIVGISFFTKAIDGNAIAIINKCLRGYMQLGTYVFIERAKLMQQYGYTKAYIGPINNDFKKKFIPCSDMEKSYYFEIYRADYFNPNQKYLSMIF